MSDQDEWSDPALMTRWLAVLFQKLRRRCRHVDEHLLVGSIEDALMHHIAHPELFNPCRGSLLCYLEWRARSYLDKKLGKVRRRRKHEEDAGVSEKYFERIVSEVRTRRGIYIWEDKSEQELEEQEEPVQRWRASLAVIVADLNPRDRAGVRLLCEKTSFEDWVRHLGIEHLPHEEQHRKVNVEKDRLMKKLKRRARKMQGGGGSSLIGLRFQATGYYAAGERESWLMRPRVS